MHRQQLIAPKSPDMSITNSDYYHYYNQKYDLPKAEKKVDLTSATAILQAYNDGMRVFKNIEIENGSFFGETLEGIVIEDSRIYADFRNANLKSAIIRNTFLKMSDFRYANLTNAHFENVNVEFVKFGKATVNDFAFKNNSAFGNNDLQLKDFKRLFLQPIPDNKYYLIDLDKNQK